MKEKAPQKTVEKALAINLDPNIYGTLAEIGAGQEVARNFFIAGGAAGTIAKTMSAYDMQVSDSIYGEEESGRYVTQSRVRKMLTREYDLVVERLSTSRHPQTQFFAFADTVAAKAYRSKKDCHGWLGIRFQHEAQAAPSDIVLHVRMMDKSNLEQQAAIGMLGVNLIYGAFYQWKNPEHLIISLLDQVGNERLEVDMIDFQGPAFEKVDNRLMALQLVKCELARSIMFTKEGNPIQPSDLLYKKDIMVLRGSFRPITNVHLDIIRAGRTKILQEKAIDESNLVFLAEVSMAKLFNEGEIDRKDFLGRVDTLCKLGFNVQISNYVRYFRLKEYLSLFTNQNIFFVLGIRKVLRIFQNKYYEGLRGGILEGLGQLFSGNAKLFVYPKIDENQEIATLDNLEVYPEVKYLFKHFVSTGEITPLENFDENIIKTGAKSVREEMQHGDESSWKDRIPKIVYEEIKKQGLFGYKKS